jgi:hypothetical protein
VPRLTACGAGGRLGSSTTLLIKIGSPQASPSLAINPDLELVLLTICIPSMK